MQVDLNILGRDISLLNKANKLLLVKEYHRIIGVDKFVGKVFLVGLQLNNFLLHRVSCNKTVNKHTLGLPNSMCARCCLHLGGRIPPWVKNKNVIGSG